MTYTPSMLLHITGGILAIVAGFAALFVRKGSRLHRSSGNVFTVSMLGMAAGGAYMAFVKSQDMNIVAGIFTIYLVTTAWLTVRRRNGIPGRAELGLAVVALGLSFFSVALGWQAANAAVRHRGEPPAMFFIFATIAFLSATGDMRMLVRGGVTGAQRMVRHLWRMCFSLFIATGSFFLGQAGDPAIGRNGLRARLFTKAVRATHLPPVPVFLVLILMVYWVIRVKFGKQYKQGAALRPQREAHLESSTPSITGITATAGGSK